MTTCQERGCGPSPVRAAVPLSVRSGLRPCVRGKFLFIGEEKLYVQGVTYGTFRPDENGDEYPHPQVVERDFAQMAANGVNAIRTYTVPPRWVLDAAQRHGLRLMVGLGIERYVGYLIDRNGAPDLEGIIRARVRACAGHPAILCYAIGNEIPAPMVRWLGRRRVERLLTRLYRAAKDEDPDGLVTYVNYPSTEYLQLPFLDFACFNVYLESQERLEAYLARLQNIVGDRPLVMSEIGLDSVRNGEETQAEVLGWQVRTTFAAGCAGALVYAWTDEWFRGGAEVLDWDFGLTRRDRTPKPALAAVRAAFAEVPFPSDMSWPSISVVVCSYNGARTIRHCLEGLLRLEYPHFEVIVVDDGSSDATAAIARKYPIRVISTENRGLSSARNTGLQAASGDIIAYIDDDAYPDPHWLTYLAATFLSTSHAGVGGPNIAPCGDGPIAECVDNAPGNPTHILFSDREAEHIPGCNMAFRKACLAAIGGFDAQFRVAGDDVDICWRLQQQGWTLGFSPAAMVWHHRRDSVRAFWKQQRGYGKAESLLEQKWPEKYNVAGHLTWAGRVYGKGLPAQWVRVGRIYHGIWGSAPFQSLYQPAPSGLWALTTTPEWYLVIAALVALSTLGTLQKPLLLALPLLALALGALLVQAGVSAASASFVCTPRSRISRLKLRSLTAFLYLVQPLARLYGRLRHGITPWRRRGAPGFAVPRPRTVALWSQRWQDSNERLRTLEAALRADGGAVVHGGDFDRWDLEARGGLLGAVRILMAVEEHGQGEQLVRLRSWPRCSGWATGIILIFGAFAAEAATRTDVTAALFAASLAGLLSLRMFCECAVATASVLQSVQEHAATDTVIQPHRQRVRAEEV